MRTLHLGPEELLVAAKIAVEHDDTAAEVAQAIDAAERRIREAVPIARVIYLEPDLDRTPSSAGGAAPQRRGTDVAAAGGTDRSGRQRLRSGSVGGAAGSGVRSRRSAFSCSKSRARRGAWMRPIRTPRSRTAPATAGSLSTRSANASSAGEMSNRFSSSIALSHGRELVRAEPPVRALLPDGRQEARALPGIGASGGTCRAAWPLR